MGRIEGVLALYAEPPVPARPVVCLDERPTVLHDHVRPPLPPTPGAPAREAYEHKRCGTGCLAVAFDPHRGWRHVWVGERRTALDLAGWLRELVDGHDPEAALIRSVVDNLNAHGLGALYEAVAAEVAAREAERNAAAAAVTRQFTTTAARTKLHRLYPHQDPEMTTVATH